MPTENEFKYVIAIDAIGEIINKYDEFEIFQAYLSDGVRIRSIAEMDDSVILSRKNFLTVKKFTARSNRLIEIETEIDDRDFDDLMSISIRQLHKWRYDVEGWDVDFFDDTDGYYFALAELELPEGSGPPKYMPPILQKYFLPSSILLRDKLTSFELENVQQSKKLYESIKSSSKWKM